MSALPFADRWKATRVWAGFAVLVGLVYGRLSERGRAWIDLIGTLVLLLPFAAFTLWLSWPAVRNSWAVREVSPDPGGLPRYPIKAVILVAFGLLILQGVSEVIRRAAFLADRRPAGEVREETRRGIL